MKCPLCKGPTDVKMTRKDGDVILRRRICFNDHSFMTEEKAITTPRPKRDQRRKKASE